MGRRGGRRYSVLRRMDSHRRHCAAAGEPGSGVGEVLAWHCAVSPNVQWEKQRKEIRRATLPWACAYRHSALRRYCRGLDDGGTHLTMAVHFAIAVAGEAHNVA